MTISRRDFIKNTAIAGVTLGLGDALYGRVLNPSAGAITNRTIVVVNLFGGNDGLNTVIPLNQYDQYARLRPRLAYTKSSILSLNGTTDFGLNPAMGSLRDLFNKGKVAIINGVGVPVSAYGLFDHAAGQYEYQSCDISGTVKSAPPTGWLGRYLDSQPEGVISRGVDLGGGRLLLTGTARTPLTIGSIEDFQLLLSFDADSRYRTYKDIMDNTRSPYPVADKNRKIRSQALRQSGVIRDKTSGYVPSVTYPDYDPLSQALRQCAQIITGNLGVKALTVGIGGFDTHYQQNGDTGGGLLYHETLLKSVSDSVSLFYSDLEAHGFADRVLTLTISEFGRRPYENNDIGTDHGLSSCAFAIGNAVKGGFYGGYPDLTESKLVLDGNLNVTTDFRSLYSTVVAKFMDADPVKAVGGNFPLLSFL